MNRESIWNALDVYLENQGYSLVQVIVQTPAVPNICVMIEHKETFTLSIEECAKLSVGVQKVLKEKLLLTDLHILEISSPGVERPLVTPAHYRRYKGSRVLVGVRSSLNDGQKYEGILKNVLGSGIVLELNEDDILSIEWSFIKFCKLLYKFENKEEKER
ncbi:ribosome maturation factor RimP [Holospora curviuscula]|uniref:Ribosome maturation factor RimP n=1 Tax=Holospora curviuscula TaxID=1082868 RepID=A0A2S5RA29_9PROT|nr:hypothetical protein [Holospora curviuscula]PPE04184.1 Ribosome maturation factor RimP [Holospora curviuscula]